MIGKHVVIDTLDNFKAKLDLIPSSAIVLIKDVGQIYAHGTYFGAQKTYSLLTKTADGLAPKGGTSASSLISNVDTEWVLTVTNGANPSWRKLPANAFNNTNYYRPISVNGTAILGNNNTALNLVAGSNITITPEKSGDAYTGKVTITSVNTTYDLLINGSLAFTPAETAITNDDLNSNHLKKTVSIVRGSWNYAGNGYTAASDWGNIDLAGTTIIKVGGSTSGYTQLFITPNTASTTSALKGEILYYIDNGDNYSPTWYRVLTNANYGSYLGYIGTTAVLKSSTALALTGITSATLSSTLTLTGTTSDKARINFSRGSDHDYPYNYITAPTGGIISIEPGGLSCSSTTGYLFTSSAFLPAVTNTYNLGTSTLKWNNIYATTFTGALSGNAASSTYTTYIRVTETEPTSGTYYYPIWTTGMSDGSNYIPRANDGFRYYSLEGTTSTKGTGLLFLGNSTAEGTAGNKEGRLGIYGPKSYYAYLYGPDTATGTFYFPNTGGTLVTHATRGTAVGSTTTPVYIAASGRATAGSTYAGGTKVTLNGTEKGATTASFYAPTAVGTSGYILKSNGSGAPTWIALSSITAGSATYTYRLAESSVSNVNTPNWKSGGISVDLFNKDASNKPYTGNNANGVINFSFGKHGTSGYYGFLLAHGNSSDRLYFRLATGTSSSTSNFTDWKTIAYTSDIPTVTNYYWANVKISASSSTSTSPTFATATMTRGVVGGYNNTTYALSTASFICNSWVRTVGSTGWYNETHGGGWYMIDGSWLRNYGSKPLYISVATYPSIVCNAQGGSEANIRFEIAGANKGYTGYKTSYGTFLWNSTALKYVYLSDNGYFYTQSYINVGAGNEKNASNPPYVWGVNGSDNFMRTYATSSLSVNYATSAGNADTLDGLHANAFLTRQRMTNPSSGTSYHGAVPYAIALKAAGTPLYADPEFASGNNSVAVYNNSGNGVVTITRVADSSAANSSGYVLKIVNSGGTSTPGRGGFHLNMSSRQNAVFAQIFRAKIPTGYSVVNAENTMGTGYKTFWLTDTAGTGKWEWYIRITICGSGGTYSSGGHVYLDGSGAVTWYLAYANVIDLTKGQYDGLNSIRWCGYLLSVVSALPSSPNSNTIYFVT